MLNVVSKSQGIMVQDTKWGVGRRRSIISVLSLAALLLVTAGNSGAKKNANVDAKDNEGQTALMRAAAAGNADSVAALIAARADVKVKDLSGRTALTLAAKSGHAAVVKLLLEAGANKDTKTKKDARALVEAAQGGYSDVVKLLLDAGSNKNAFVIHPAQFTRVVHDPVAARSSLQPGETYIGSGLGGLSITITVTQPEFAGDTFVSFSGTVPQTALNLAALNGYVDVVKLLLDAGAYQYGIYGLYSGQIMGTPGVLAHFAPHFSFMNVRETALEAARQGNHQNIVDLLISAGMKE